MTLNFLNELFKVDACVSSCSNSMINTTGVLESTDNMKKMEILAKYGHFIQHIEPNMERRISNTPVNENNDLSISLFFWCF